MKYWSETEIAILRENSKEGRWLTYLEIGPILNRSKDSIGQKRSKLHLLRPRNTGKKQMHKKWDPEEEAFVKKYFPTLVTEDMAAKLGRSLSSVRHRATQLKLKKTVEYKSWIRFGPRTEYSLEQVNSDDLAYVAGLFDGEGWFHFYWQPPKYMSKTQGLRVAIGNTDGETLTQLKTIFNLGCITRAHKPSKYGTVMTQWYLTGWQAICFLKAILPYLRIRRKDAESAILKWETDRRVFLIAQ